MTAVGSALNEGRSVDFIEFEGKAVPGSSGGPVFDNAGNVIGLIREAWTKKGIKGGTEAPMNRAFSIGNLSILGEEVMAPPGAPMPPSKSNLSFDHFLIATKQAR